MTATPVGMYSPMNSSTNWSHPTPVDTENMDSASQTSCSSPPMLSNSRPAFTIPEYHPSRQSTPVKTAPSRSTSNSYIPPHIPQDETTTSSTVGTPATLHTPSSSRSDLALSVPSSPQPPALIPRHYSVAAVPQKSNGRNMTRHYSIATTAPYRTSNLRAAATLGSPNGRYMPPTAMPNAVSPSAVDLSSPPGYFQNVAESFTDRGYHFRSQSSPHAQPISPYVLDNNYTPFYTNNAFSATHATHSTRSSVSDSPSRRTGRGLGILDNDPSIYLPAVDEHGNEIEDSSLANSLWETAARWASFAGKRFSAGEKEIRRVLGGQGVRTGSGSSADDGF